MVTRTAGLQGWEALIGDMHCGKAWNTAANIHPVVWHRRNSSIWSMSMATIWQKFLLHKSTVQLDLIFISSASWARRPDAALWVMKSYHVTSQTQPFLSPRSGSPPSISRVICEINRDTWVIIMVNMLGWLLRYWLRVSGTTIEWSAASK